MVPAVLKRSEMQTADFEERCLLQAERLTEFEQEFCRYVQSNAAEASAKTISALAEQFFVSPNAIVRLARKLGYAGFSDMRISLRHELENSDIAEHLLPNEQAQSTLDLVTKTLEFCCSPAKEQAAAKILSRAERIAFFAVGETAYAAHTYARIFNEFDGKSQFITYENQIKRELSRAAGLVLFLISMSGETRQVVNVAAAAKRQDATVLTLTDLHPCKLVKYATIAIYCCSPQHYIGDVNTTDLTPLFAALKALEGAYFDELGVTS